MRNFILQPLIFLLLFHSPFSASAFTKWKTSTNIERAREALALGEMKKWEEALRLADQSFEEEKTKMSFSQRNNFELWIALFWSKYHQFRGALPPVKKAADFENRKDLNHHMNKVEEHLEHLKKGLNYLKTYNVKYMQIARRTDLKEVVYLNSSLNLERDLHGTIRQGQIYLSLLHYINQNWDNKTKIEKKFKEQKSALKKIQGSQSTIEKQHQDIKQKQIKLAKVVKKIQSTYTSVEQRFEQQGRNATILTWSGAVIMTAGASLLGVGLYYYIGQNDNTTSISNREIFKQLTVIYSVAGGSAFALGFSSLLTGIMLRPSTKNRTKAVIGSHNKYLETIGPEKTQQTSLRQDYGKKAPLPRHQNTFVMGKW